MNISKYIFYYLQHTTILTFICVFMGAFILSFSSCTLVRIPIVLGFMGGLSESKKTSIKILLGFISGLVFSYTALGIIMGLSSRTINKFPLVSAGFYYIGGITLLLFGLYLLGFIPYWRPKSCSCLSGSQKKKYNLGFWGAVFFGITFAFMEAPVCPCCGPVLFMLAIATFSQGKFLFGIIIFFIYALGQSTPILLIGMSSNFLKFSTKNIHKIEGYIESAAAAILICFGIYLLWLA